MTGNIHMRTFPHSEQPSRRWTAAALNRSAVGGRRSSGAGTVRSMGDAGDSGRDEEIRKAIGMIRSGLDILLSHFDDGEPIPIAELLANRAERRGSRLTDAETEVLTRYAEGETVEMIAESRGVSTRTIDNQIAAAVQKLGFGDRRELVGYLEGVREATARRPASE